MSRILVVEDDETLRHTLVATLTRLGYEVAQAGNGREAMQVCSARAPDLVLTDILMPEQEGLETISRLRRLYPAVKIVGMSGGGRAPAIDYLKMAKQMGAGAVLAKPFDTEALKAALAEASGEARA